MALKKLLEFHTEISRLKKTRRYSTCPEHAQDTTTSHSWALAFLAVDCIERLGLENLDPIYSMKIALVHDIGEIGMEYDVDSLDIIRGNISKQEKDEQELRSIKRLLSEFEREDIYEIWADYEEGRTREARYIKALDKIEAIIHLTQRNYIGGKDDERDISALCADKAVLDFPELRPLLKEAKSKLKKIFRNQNAIWKPEYDKV